MIHLCLALHAGFTAFQPDAPGKITFGLAQIG